MNEEIKNLAHDSHRHGEKARDLFDAAVEGQRAADDITDPHEHHEAMQPVHRKDLEAVAEIRAAVKLDAERMKKQREDLQKQWQDLRTADSDS